jgi:TrmH family RNA methyltransferase
MTLPPMISSRTNERVKQLRAAFSGKASEDGDLMAIEGEHLIGEAVAAGRRLQTVFVREGSEKMLEREALRDLQPEQWLLLGREAFDSAVDTHSPQGIAATLKIPLLLTDTTDASGVTLMLEDIQDPGNLGTLLRSAKAFGVSSVWVSGATVNPWNPKVVRSSAGAIFSMVVRRTNVVEQAKLYQQRGARVLAAVTPRAGAVYPMLANVQPPCVWMIGNEGAGLSAEALAIADELVTIPVLVESLNAAVAGSIVLYETMRQGLVARADADGRKQADELAQLRLM